MANSFTVLITLASAASLLTPVVGRSDILTNNNAHQGHAHQAVSVEKGLNTEDLNQWNGGIRLQNQARNVNFMRVEHEDVGTLSQQNDDGATNSNLEFDEQEIEDRYDQVDNQEKQFDDGHQQAKHKREEKELFKGFFDDLEPTIEHETQHSIAEHLGKDSQDMQVNQSKCMSSSDRNIYIFIADATKDPYGILVAIRTAWRLQYPVQLQHALKGEGFKMVNRKTVDSWISQPHTNGGLPKSVKSFPDSITTEPCSWHEVDAVSKAAVSRGQVFFWSGSVQINRKQDSALGGEVFVDFKSPDTADLGRIRKVLLQTYPEVEIGLILGTAAIMSVVLLCAYAWYRMTRRYIPEWMRGLKKADRKALFESVELRTRN